MTDPEAYQGCFVFADWSIWVQGYAIRLSPPGDCSVLLIGNATGVTVADSFAAFLDKYLHNQIALFPVHD
jgi:hypothetical protein